MSLNLQDPLLRLTGIHPRQTGGPLFCQILTDFARGGRRANSTPGPARGAGRLVLHPTCSYLQAGRLVLRLTCSYLQTGRLVLHLTCSYLQAGRLVLHLTCSYLQTGRLVFISPVTTCRQADKYYISPVPTCRMLKNQCDYRQQYYAKMTMQFYGCKMKLFR